MTVSAPAPSQTALASRLVRLAREKSQLELVVRLLGRLSAAILRARSSSAAAIGGHTNFIVNHTRTRNTII